MLSEGRGKREEVKGGSNAISHQSGNRPLSLSPSLSLLPLSPSFLEKNATRDLKRSEWRREREREGGGKSSGVRQCSLPTSLVHLLRVTEFVCDASKG